MTEPIGLKRGTVNVVEYQQDWKAAFDTEKQLLLQALNGCVWEVEHVGSTAVPGLAAKPIIDMIASVDDLSVYKKLVKPLTALGYEFMPDRIFDDRVFFPKGARENRTHHLSLVVKGSKGWTQPITFRDYLIKNESVRKNYQTLKIELAAKYPNDRASYTKAKERLIKQILAQAQKEAAQ